jgi:hypothetical protein
MLGGAAVNNTVATALDLAENHGFPILPCRWRDETVTVDGEERVLKRKSPLTGRGFSDASRDPAQIRRWWQRWPDALIGVRTGNGSGLFVIDIDPDGIDWYTNNSERLAAGRVHKTERGYHLLYRDAGLGCTSKSIAPGVDSRGEGGYVIWWPAHGQPAVGDLEDVGELPAWARAAFEGAAAGVTRKTAEASHPPPTNGGIKTDRSADLMGRVALDVRAGKADYEIHNIHGDHPHARDQADPHRAVQRCIDRARSEIDAGNTGSMPAPGPTGAITADDFVAYMPMHAYIFIPSREVWPAASVNVRCAPPRGPDGEPVKRTLVVTGKDGRPVTKQVPMQPADYIDLTRPVDQMTWAPGLPLMIPDRLISGGGWIEREGVACFNLYLPPQVEPGDAGKAGLWLEHVRAVYPDDADHIVRWLAQRVQRPGDKINHALVLGGAQGIGKDTILEPVKYAIGPWNFAEVAPTHLLGRFNGFLKSVILRISEARDLGDVDRYALYDHTKTLIAAPPDVLRCDEKHIREHSVPNVVGVIITTNHKTDGIYLPADDRRHYVAWSERTREEFTPEYWNGIYQWYAAGGRRDVAAYLATLDLSTFDAKAPPRKTLAFYDIVDANRAPEDAELADVLERLGNPIAVTLAMLVGNAVDDAFKDWLTDRRNRRQIPHRLETAGYVPLRNDTAKDGLWKIGGRRQAVYALANVPLNERIRATTALTGRTW